MNTYPPPLPILAIVSPCFNEEEVLAKSADALGRLLEEMTAAGKISPESFVCFVDDGSRDGTRAIIRELCSRAGTRRFRGVCLSRNFGHQSALLAGLFSVEADAYVSIDADLQDDERVIPEMLEKFRAEGCDIVYGVRKKRDTDTFFKRNTALAFYALQNLLCGGNAVFNHADFRLMSRRAVRELSRFREVNLYLRGLVPLLGFKSARVFYERKARELGESKYPLGKMLRLAWNGIVNFSEVPLRLMTGTGIAGGVGCLFALAFALIQWARGNTVPGWATVVFAVAAVGSIQMISLGVLGSYIGKIFLETKRRPTFIVEEILGGNAKENPPDLKKTASDEPA